MKDLPIEEIYKLHKSGLSAKMIAKDYDVHETTLLRKLHKYCDENGIKFKKQINGHRPKKELPMDEVCKLYESNVSSIEIAKKFECCCTTVLSKLHDIYDNCDDEKSVKSRGKPKLDLPMDEIYELYQLEISATELAHEYGCSPATIRQKIKEYCAENDLDMRKFHNSVFLSMEQVYSDYKKGTTYSELVNKYGFSRVTLKNRLYEYCKENNLTLNRKVKYKSKNNNLKIQNQAIFLRQLKEILEKLKDNEETKKLTKTL